MHVFKRGPIVIFKNVSLRSDHTSEQLPLLEQHNTSLTRSSAGIAIDSFSAKRKRHISIPHHVVRSNFLCKARPTDEPIESFSDKRRRIDNIYVRTGLCPAPDVLT